MAGNVVGVAMVGALRARGSASGDADRSRSARARAGDEVEVWGGKHKKGQGARLGDVMRRTSALRLDAEGGPPLAFAHLP
jgi:hypothetical protein